MDQQADRTLLPGAVMKLALRNGPAPAASWAQRLLSKFIQYRLMTQWPHAGVVIDEPDGQWLYHVNGSHGMVRERLTAQLGDWQLLPVAGDAALARTIFNSLRAAGGGYDYVELLGFTAVRSLLRVAAKNKGIARRLERNTYCYQLALWMLSGKRPTFRVTPELLLLHASHTLA